LGTGIPLPKNLDNNPNLLKIAGLASGVSEIATNCEKAHYEMEKLSAVFPEVDARKYCRLNAGPTAGDMEWVTKTKWLGLSSETYQPWAKKFIEMDDWSDMEEFEKVVEAYLSGDEEKEEVNWCLGVLSSEKSG
jgi:hypothetical protein